MENWEISLEREFFCKLTFIGFLFLLVFSLIGQFDRDTDKPQEHEEDVDYVKVCGEVIPRSADMITGYATSAGIDTYTRTHLSFSTNRLS